MKAFFIWLFILLSTLERIAAYTGYYDCSDDDCYFYETWTDPRKPYMDLFLDLEDQINANLSLPNVKYGLEFYHGYLYIDTEDLENECACPLILKENKTFVTFHATDDLIMYYNYKFPFSQGKDGKVEISCEYSFSSLLMNDTNQAPVFLKVELTNLHIFNFVPYGIPMKWFENLSEKNKKIFLDVIKPPVKTLVEGALLKALNEALKKNSKGLKKKYRWLKKNRRFHNIQDNFIH